MGLLLVPLFLFYLRKFYFSTKIVVFLWRNSDSLPLILELTNNFYKLEGYHDQNVNEKNRNSI